ncbi:enoyl-CoA hydratase/isomerase family protein [Intrasporangium calvum]|uniref:Enoyl-CoA hydratase/isomerase n=1 Tax=Intrasporangium calvum (strain ATCC 23552 / DSM 43043 / JCM 3097 / NBRC 12989 / NCIMB 10167 / NRRL B-3866 / 7 KIP) TaxID=710696 RepID=E6SCL2_INTC7|nr:enoyl-CoA hydratase/isomerase family protein [Intrasporangium calvum]ADU49616.1 Enoyl-CoA hydratase/isomerase [Intrasporangium calvum DSM 43043]
MSDARTQDGGSLAFETLEVDTDGPIGRIRLNRPDQRNAISRTMLGEIVEATRQISAAANVRAVVLEARGPAFCAGVDLADFESFMGSPGSVDSLLKGADNAITMAALGREAANALSALRQVTVAKVHGYAVGAGAVLALSADLRVLSEDAYYWIPEVELGTPLVWGAIPRLVAEIGPARTKDLVTTCRRVPAEEALRLGLASRVVPSEELDSTTEQIAQALAGRARYAIEATKGHVDAVARAMVMGDTTYADRYLQAASWLDREVRERAEQYLTTFHAGNRSETR